MLGGGVTTFRGGERKAMETNAVIEAVNRFVLKPLGFVRKGALFNRHRGEFVDVVDFPLNKGGDALTLEVGIQHDGLYQALWEAPPPRFVNEASCIVHAHIGDLMDEGREVWWPLADPASPDLAVKAVEGPVLRFLQSHHDLGAIAAELTRSLDGHRAPMPMLYLAILRHRRGDAAGAQALIAEVRRDPNPDWAFRAGVLAVRLLEDESRPTA
jgi:hypothetical protein